MTIRALKNTDPIVRGQLPKVLMGRARIAGACRFRLNCPRLDAVAPAGARRERGFPRMRVARRHNASVALGCDSGTLLSAASAMPSTMDVAIQVRPSGDPQ